MDAREHESLESFRADRRDPGPGPLAVLVCEDGTEAAGSLGHLLGLGFRRVFLVAEPRFDAAALPSDAAGRVEIVRDRARRAEAAMDAVNALIDKAPGAWIHYCYNAEYLFYPFCEHRTVGELTAWVMEERRASILAFVVDLYAGDLARYPDGVDPDAAYLDAMGYHAETRRSPRGEIMERQLDFRGGLRWRFEEHVSADRRRIDRVALFQARPGLRLRPDHTLSDEEMNTYECAWHHSLTGAICSFRAAKALRTNPGSRHDVHDFRWHGSARFGWSSQQLMELGLMEPGQWF